VNILLDENLDWRLGRDLPGHTVEAVAKIGWAGLKNGILLTEAQKRFDILLTMDSNMVHQQNLATFRIAVIALKARSNRLADTRPLMPKVLRLLPTVKQGELIFVS
jgi:predicted nuclease of predicted toxin-antitoxin system